MLKLNKKYLNLIKAGKEVRYYIIVGGRGSSKSFSTTTFLTGLTFERNHNILFTRYTMKSAHISIIPEFREKIELMELERHFDVNLTDITNVQTDSKILFRGIKTSSGIQTAALKSLQGITTWVVDEAEELVEEDTFDKIDLSIRQLDMHNRVILILNPTTKEHWIYKRFYEKRGIDPKFNGIVGDTCYIHTDYRDNIENLSPSFIRNVENMKKNNIEKYNHTILGAWRDRAEGVIFHNWKLGKFNPDGIPSVFGQDYGFSNDASTLIEVAICKKTKKIFIKEHFYKKGLTTSEIASLNTKYAGRNMIVGDSSEPRLIKEMQGKGNNVIAVKKGKDSVITGITMLMDYELIVDPSSENVVKEMNNYIWMDKKSNTPIDNWNHCIDAIRYAVYHQLMNPMYGKYSIM